MSVGDIRSRLNTILFVAGGQKATRGDVEDLFGTARRFDGVITAPEKAELKKILQAHGDTFSEAAKTRFKSLLASADVATPKPSAAGVSAVALLSAPQAPRMGTHAAPAMGAQPGSAVDVYVDANNASAYAVLSAEADRLGADLARYNARAATPAASTAGYNALVAEHDALNARVTSYNDRARAFAQSNPGSPSGTTTMNGYDVFSGGGAATDSGGHIVSGYTTFSPTTGRPVFVEDKLPR